MLILALDTALAAATAVVSKDEQVLGVRCEPMARGHQEAIAVLAREAMREAGAEFSALERIGVTVGPGSFTGLRVGIAFAKGVALAWNTPLVGFGALDALRFSVSATNIASTIDAGRGQVYLQLQEGEAQQMTIEAALDAIASAKPEMIVGSGAPLLSQAAPGAQIDPRPYPSAVALVRLTLRASTDDLAKPLYLRAPDAKTLAERGIVR